MAISIRARFAIAAIAASGLLGGCSGGGSPSSFAPSESTQQNVNRSGTQGSVTYYYLNRLTTLGGIANQAYSINDRSQIGGFSFVKGNSALHAVMWRQYRATDLGTLGGPNSAIEYYSHGTRGQFVGWSEISKTDPYAENFCGFGTSHICRGFSWRLGKMTSLPTLGGNNAQADDVNNRGQIIGAAETSTKDASCAAPQVYDFYGVIWQPNGKITSLTPYSRDTVSLATAVNQTGAVVGSSGPCANLFTHAVLWNLGSTIKLGSLGGSEAWAQDINNRGQITGTSLVRGNKAFHAFLWQNGTMTDLGALRGYPSSYALGMNDKGQIVGESCTASALCHGFIWQNDTMTDLNTLIPPKTKLYIFDGTDINNSGQIAAIAVNTERHARAVVLVPGRKADGPSSVSAPTITLPENLLMQLRNPRVPPFGHFPRLTVQQ